MAKSEQEEDSMKVLTMSHDCECFCCSGRAGDPRCDGPPWVAWAGLTRTKGQAHVSIFIGHFKSNTDVSRETLDLQEQLDL